MDQERNKQLKKMQQKKKEGMTGERKMGWDKEETGSPLSEINLKYLVKSLPCKFESQNSDK